MTDIVQELRDYPAVDPRMAVIAVDPLPDGYCIVPRTSVLQAADDIASLKARIEELQESLRGVLEIASRNESGPAIERARAALKGSQL